MIKIEKDKLITFIKKRHKQHLEEINFDGFSVCPVQDQKQMRVAPRCEWRGTEQSREEALKQQKLIDQTISCEFCSLCEEVVGKLGGD